jgi:hypothetical protein
MTIPEELHWIQQLIDRLGVAGTLTLITMNCCDRAEAGNERWARLAEIVSHAAEQARKLEPERTQR